MMGVEVAIGAAIDAIVAQIGKQSANKDAVKALKVFHNQTKGHMDLFEKLQEQIKQKPDCAGVDGLLGEMRRDYENLCVWLNTRSDKCKSWIKGFVRADKYAKEIKLQMNIIDTSMRIKQSFVQTMLAGILKQGQDQANEEIMHIGIKIDKIQDQAATEVQHVKMLAAIEELDQKIEQRTMGQVKLDDGISEHDITMFKDDVLGHGAFGVVYSGKLRKGGTVTEVAVKMLHSHISAERYIQMFKKEINLVREANHACSSAYVCRFYGACIIGNKPCLVMKRYASSLTDHLQIAADGRLGLAASCRMALKIAVGLQQLHRAGFVHSDVKPCNILLDEASNAVLADFSVSHYFKEGAASAYLPSRDKLGTRHYRAPECASPNAYGGIRRQADIWSFAATMLRMLTGEHPYADQDSDEGVCESLRKKEPPKVPQEHGQVSDMLKRCFSFDPKERPTLEEILKILRQAESESEQATSASAPPRNKSDGDPAHSPSQTLKATSVLESLLAPTTPQPASDEKSAYDDIFQAHSRDASDQYGVLGNQFAAANLGEELPATGEVDSQQVVGAGKQPLPLHPPTPPAHQAAPPQPAPAVCPPASANEAQARTVAASKPPNASLLDNDAGDGGGGQRNGSGVMPYPDGACYEGGWKDGEKHVKGIFTWPDGRRYEGERRYGKEQG